MLLYSNDNDKYIIVTKTIISIKINKMFICQNIFFTIITEDNFCILQIKYIHKLLFGIDYNYELVSFLFKWGFFNIIIKIYRLNCRIIALNKFFKKNFMMK